MSPDRETALDAFPFSALSAYEASRRVLGCLVIDPRLGGALLCGSPGSGRRLLLESFLGFVVRQGLEDAVARVPGSADPLALEGGTDLERSLLEGRTVHREGLLPRHRGGLLLLENLDGAEVGRGALLGRWLEGRGAGTRFLAVAATPPPHLAGLARRLAFHVRVDGPRDDAARARLLSRRLAFDRDPAGFAGAWAEAERQLARTLDRARDALASVSIPDGLRAELARDGVARRRTDLRREMLALRAARAHAALAGRREVDTEDLAFAAQHVLGHDAEPEAPTARSTPASPPSGGREGDRDEAPADGAGDGDVAAPAADEVLPPVAAALPALEPTPGETPAGARRGRRGRLDSWERGRPVGVVRGPLRGRRVALLPTLREAAVRQRFRASRRPGPGIEVRREDLRVRRFREKAGTAFILAVDASGSMAFHRMREAKGAALSLLRDAYVNRDAVALIAVRGEAARVVLPPTTALARARRELEVLPTGGGTPLASALASIVDVARGERRRGGRRLLAVLLTDGRANVPTVPASSIPPGQRARVVREELERACARYAAERIPTVVVETSRPGIDRADGRALARRLGARHLLLSRDGAEGLARRLRDFVASDDPASGDATATRLQDGARRDPS